MPTRKVNGLIVQATNMDMLDKIQDQMKARLAELQPQVDEYREIELAMKRMTPRGRPKGSKNKPKVEATPES